MTVETYGVNKDFELISLPDGTWQANAYVDGDNGPVILSGSGATIEVATGFLWLSLSTAGFSPSALLVDGVVSSGPTPPASSSALIFKGAVMTASPITQITLVEGGAAVHVTVYDQTTTNAIPPANITWQASSVVNVAANSTGFNISAVARSTAFSFVLTATDTAQTPNVSAGLTINIVLPAITALTFTSP